MQAASSTVAVAGGRFDEGMMSTTEAAAFLGIGRTTLYRLMASGELPSLTVRNKRLIARADARAYLARLAAEQA